MLVLAASLGAQSTPPVTIHDFAQVNDSLWRGAAPSDLAVQQLRQTGVKRIIDLREPGEATLHEAARARSENLVYINVPFRPWSAPSGQQVRSVLALLLNDSRQKTFIHCRRGKDRTGTVIACYRIQHDGWTNQRALEEAIHFGMSRMQRSMREFIVAFSPMSVLPVSVRAMPLAARP